MLSVRLMRKCRYVVKAELIVELLVVIMVEEVMEENERRVENI